LSIPANRALSPPGWESWRCAYELKTGEFSVLPDFADYDAKAVKTPG
jgi:hypothetical protein